MECYFGPFLGPGIVDLGRNKHTIFILFMPDTNVF